MSCSQRTARPVGFELWYNRTSNEEYAGYVVWRGTCSGNRSIRIARNEYCRLHHIFSRTWYTVCLLHNSRQEWCTRSRKSIDQLGMVLQLWRPIRNSHRLRWKKASLDSTPWKASVQSMEKSQTPSTSESPASICRISVHHAVTIYTSN